MRVVGRKAAQATANCGVAHLPRGHSLRPTTACLFVRRDVCCNLQCRRRLTLYNSDIQLVTVGDGTRSDGSACVSSLIPYQFNSRRRSRR
jgi:hypothetical protein